MEYLDLTIEEMKKAIDSKEVTSLELTEAAIKRANDLQKDINAFVTITSDSSIEEAKKPKTGLLAGIPCAIKDNFSTKGILSTSSSNILKDYIPTFDATAVSKLKDAGAISIGKTVLDELAMGGTGTTGHTGAVHNPWDTSRLIGGSSAGSSAAVAAGIVPFTLGSDTGDSIRKPAGFGGVVGYKPTYGRISRFGLFPFASSLDHVGCFARSVKDIAYVMDALKGSDEKDMTSLKTEDIMYHESITNNATGKKLFVIKEIVDKENYKDDMDEELEAVFNNFDEVIKHCKELGMTVDEVSVDKDLLKAIFSAYMTISCAEATSNNSNLTGITFGSRGSGNSIDEIMFDARTKGFSELIKRRFVLGSYVLQKENQEKLFLNSKRVRHMIVNKINELFKEYDGFILPVSGGPAPLAQSDNINKLSDRYLLMENHLAIANFGGYPSITIPSGKVKGLPIAINITGPIKEDLNVLNMAYALEEVLGYVGQIANKEEA